jgi:hypothetical protein
MRMYAVAAVLLGLIGLSVAASGQEFALQFNVTYKCPDGYTYVIHKCVPGPKGGGVCYFQLGQDSERYNTRTQVENLFRTCKVIGSPSSPAAPEGGQVSSGVQADTPYQCAGGLTETLIQCQKQFAQEPCYLKVEHEGKLLFQLPLPRATAAQQLKSCKALAPFNPPYLSQFPNSDRVIQSMKVGDPHDSALRAAGAFYQLSEIIKTLGQQRGTGGFLPDENKLLDDYSRAQTNLGASSGQQLNLASNPYHFSRSDPRFGFEGIPVWTTFLFPTLQAQFAQIAGGNNPAYNAKIEEERRNAFKAAQAQIDAAKAEANLPKDRGSVAMRRCMESGRSDMECLGEGMKVGLVDLAGGNPLKGIVPEVPTGLRLSGVYSAGTFNVGFDQSTARVVCGSLIAQPYFYSVERNGTQLKVTIPISPKPLVLSFKADGKLAGPGPIEVAGRVVIGGAVASSSTTYQQQTQTTMQTRQIDAAETRNYEGTDAVHQNGMEYSVNEPVTSTSYTPVTTHSYTVPTAPKTERCNVALLPPTGSNVKISNALTQLFGTEASKSANTSPGLRLNGTYAQPGGLTIEFRDDSATLECGAAHTAEAYWVLPAGNQVAVKLQNGGTPLTLVLQPNGTLAGSGTVDVAGRKFVPTSEGDVHNFVPQNARCPVGTLTPRGGSGNS